MFQGTAQVHGPGVGDPCPVTQPFHLAAGDGIAGGSSSLCEQRLVREEALDDRYPAS